MIEQQPGIDLYYVRIPNGQEFGPADRSTILAWETQGRVNDTCQIRSQDGGELIGFALWKQDSYATPVPTSSPTGSPRYSSANVYGDQIGRVVVPANQSVAPARSRATTVLILGICSWLSCVTFFASPVCALFAIGFGIAELGRIKRGEINSDERHIVWIGIVLGVANLLFVVIFTVFGLIAAFIP
ncbi:MAG: DUF4190 domain-containing protein [Pirellula sp.]|jgi:hypothetical protein